MFVHGETEDSLLHKAPTILVGCVQKSMAISANVEVFMHAFYESEVFWSDFGNF